MGKTIILSFVGFTSIIFLLIGNKLLGLKLVDLPLAILLFVETLGASVGFLLINLVVGFLALLTVRLTTSVFIPLYLLADFNWVTLSFIQGFVFQCWRKRSSVGDCETSS